MSICKFIVSTAAIFLFSSLVFAQESPLVSIKPTPDNKVKVCLAQPNNQDICHTERMRLPFEASKIIPGKFIASDRITWLALSNSRAAACIFEEPHIVRCEALEGVGNFSKITIGVFGNELHTSLSEKASTISPEIAKRSIRSFYHSLAKAFSKLTIPPNEEDFDVDAPLTSASRDEIHNDPIDGATDYPWIDNPGSDGGYSGDIGGGEIDSCIGRVVCIPGIRLPVVIYEPVPPPELGGPNPEGGGSASGNPTMPPPQPPLDCKKVAGHCRNTCSDSTLGTPPGNDGWNWVKCYNACMKLYNCD